MKKLTMLALIVISLLITYAVPQLNANNDAIYAVYTDGDTGNGIWLYGNIYMKEYAKSDAATYGSLHNAIGYSKRYKGDYDDVLKECEQHNARIIKSETVNGVYIYYGYSDKLGKTVNVDNQHINIQLAIRGDIVTVGTPLIIGSY